MVPITAVPTTAVLTTLLGIFQGMLTAGHAAILPFGLALLAATVAIEFYLGLIYAAIDGFMNYTKLLGVVIFIVIQASIVLYVLLNLPMIGQVFFDSFIQMATSAMGGAAGAEQARIFQNPSELWAKGFVLTKPMINYLGWPSDMMSYRVAAWIIILTFLLVSLMSLMAQVEFLLAIIVAIPMLALGFLSLTSFMLGGVVRWLGGSLVRIFVLAFIIGGVMLALQPYLGPINPGVINSAPLEQDAAWILAGLSVGFFVLAWFLPSIAAGQIMGSGGGLGMAALLALGTVGVSAVSMGLGVVRGVSSLIRGH